MDRPTTIYRNEKILPNIVVAFALSVSSVLAIEVNLYVDSAPNVYGSPNYTPWWTQAKDDAVSGSFVNMANSVNPAFAGSTCMELEDMVVYSFGDLGKRLHFVYWVPDATIDDLTAKNFQIAMDYEWDGVTADFYARYFGSTWLTPGSWTEYSGGVIGTAGFAWWGAYGINTPEALADDLAAWRPYQGDVTFKVQWYGANGKEGTMLAACHNVPGSVPDAGTTFGLLGFAVVGLGMLRRKLNA